MSRPPVWQMIKEAIQALKGKATLVKNYCPHCILLPSNKEELNV